MWRQELEKASKGDMEGFMQAARLMMKPKPGPRYIGRWDWHLWNFLVALLPACAVYGLAMVGRHQYNKGEQLIALQKEKEELEAKANAPEDPVMKRIQELENRIQELQLSIWLTRATPMGSEISKISESKKDGNQGGEASNQEVVTRSACHSGGDKGTGIAKSENDATTPGDKENSVISVLGKLRHALRILDSVQHPNQEPTGSGLEQRSLDSKDKGEKIVDSHGQDFESKGQEDGQGTKQDGGGGTLRSILAFWRQSKESTD